MDYIYISHIHPDHCSKKTLELLDNNIPILIRNYNSKFLRDNIERLGFNVIELDHNKRVNLKNDLFINILAADNCNPEICQKYIGCNAPTNGNYISNSIDSMCVIDNGEQVIVNTNDCPYPIGEFTARDIKKQYKQIDMLLVGYSSASPYPQCIVMDKERKKKSRETVIKQFWSQTESYVNLLQPKVYMPFAGRYVLAGKFSVLNSDRSVAELEDAYQYFTNSKNIDHEKHKAIILNAETSFNLDDGSSSKKYIPIILNEKAKYISENLSKRKYDYELEKEPQIEELINLIPKAFERFENKRKEIGFASETNIILDLSQEKFLIISTNGDGYRISNKINLEHFTKFVKISLDARFLKWLLKGPKYAHWNNAEIGSHLTYQRNPEIYERGLYYSLNFFHV